MTAFEKTFADFQLKTETALKKTLENYKNSAPKKLFEAIEYSLMAGGKRIRPVLVFLTAQTLGKNPDDFVPYAVATEILHTYSLIHDDLPAMDNDDLRRGLPTSHIKFGEDVAILAGDTMQTMAYECIFHLRKNSNFTPEAILECAALFANATGFFGMAGGQVLDLDAENKKISLEELQEIHKRKTGALIEASIVGAAILAEADFTSRSVLINFAKRFGLIFQIVDDILDVTGDEKKLGKPVGSDIKNQKSTYPQLLGIDASWEKINTEKEKALSELKKLSNNTKDLENLLRYIIERSS